ncbi:MAG: response regulator [Bryobacteraceae bacterium]|jgi:DNA-binding NtrC family response regulator
MERSCLIVDDEPAIRAYLTAILRRERYLTLEAENAAQAFKLVQKLNGDLNLIVGDITMPGDMDGVDLAYAVRNEFPTIPVVLVSGFADTESAKHALGDFAFIRKPFTPASILGAVNSVATSSCSVCRASS